MTWRTVFFKLLKVVNYNFHRGEAAKKLQHKFTTLSRRRRWSWKITTLRHEAAKFFEIYNFKRKITTLICESVKFTTLIIWIGEIYNYNFTTPKAVIFFTTLAQTLKNIGEG